MAVGNTTIAVINKQLEFLKAKCAELDDQYNTFQYVVKDIENWASETEVGAELRKDMMTLVECFQGMIKNTRDLDTEINTFIENQKAINKN